MSGDSHQTAIYEASEERRGLKKEDKVIRQILYIFMVLTFSNLAYAEWGADTLGGSGGEIIHVTSLEDSGPGTLREALKGDNRTIVFDVAGTINMTNRFLMVLRHHITVDGCTAPVPGITLVGNRFDLNKNHDIIIRCLRFLSPINDAITIRKGSHDILLEHISCRYSGDECFAINGTGTRDVTVRWSIIGPTNKGMIVHNGSERVSVYQNVFGHVVQRSPSASGHSSVDFRNNWLHNWRSYGSRFRRGSTGNVVANLYDCGETCNRSEVDTDTMKIKGDSGPVFIRDNLSEDGVDIDGLGTRNVPYPEPPVATSSPSELKDLLRSKVGSMPLDESEFYLLGLGPAPATGDPLSAVEDPLSAVEDPLSAVEDPPPPVEDPTQPLGDLYMRKIHLRVKENHIVIDLTLDSRGDAGMPASTVSVFIRPEEENGLGELVVEVPFPAFDKSGRQKKTVTIAKPVPGRYIDTAIVDFHNEILETDEGNNIKERDFTVD